MWEGMWEPRLPFTELARNVQLSTAMEPRGLPRQMAPARIDCDMGRDGMEARP